MLGRGLNRSARQLHNGKGRPTYLSSSAKPFSLLARPQLLRQDGHPAQRLQISWRPIGISLSTQLLARFASTIPASPDSLPPPLDPLVPPSETSTIFFDGLIDPTNIAPISENIGYLKALGIDYGWGPTSTVQWILEHVHVYSGLPWWSSIMLSAILVRVTLLPLFIGASDTAARMGALNPLMEPIRARANAAQAAKNTTEVMLASKEMKALYNSSGVKLSKMAWPLIQVPLGFGTFRLMHAMAGLPVPGLENQGVLWMQDLTLADPYLVLPIVTTTCFFYAFKMGGDSGSSNAMMNPGMKNFLQYVMPGMTGAFMLFWPGCMQLTFATTACLSLGQAYLLKRPWVRNILGIQPIPTQAQTSGKANSPYKGVINMYQPPDQPKEKKGIVGGAIADIKGAADNALGRLRKTSDKRAKSISTRARSAEVRKSKALEEKRRREMEMEKQERLRAKKEKKLKDLE